MSRGRAAVCILLFLAPCVAHADSPRVPVVLVAGILGSRLCDGAGVTIWGDRTSLLRLRQLELTQTDSLPRLKPCGLIDKVQILPPFWAMHQYDSLQSTLRQLGYEKDRTLFEFAYDWRQSTTDSEKDLEEKLRTWIPSGRFDVVAHSMGGLVTRLYLNKPENKGRVRKVIYLGTPFLGSGNALATLSEGWGALNKLVPGGMDTIRQVVLSWPGYLELLPRYREAVQVKQPSGSYLRINVFDPTTWHDESWLPRRMQSGARFQSFRLSLANAAVLTDTFSSAPPDDVEEHLVASDTILTNHRVVMRESQTPPSQANWHFVKEPGDGTVPVWSAARDSSETSYANAAISSGPHATVFDDDSVKKGLKRWLLDIVPSPIQPIGREGRPTLQVSHGGDLYNWKILDTELVARPVTQEVGDDVQLDLIIQFESSETPVARVYLPAVSAAWGGAVRQVAVEEITSPAELAARQLHYRASVKAAGANDLMTIATDLPSMPLRAYVFVVPRVALPSTGGQ